MVRVSPCRASKGRHLLNVAVLKLDNIKICYFAKSFLNYVILLNILRIYIKNFIVINHFHGLYIRLWKKKLYVKEMSHYWKIKCTAKVINSNPEKLIGSFCKFNYTTYTNYMLQMMNSLNFLYNWCIDSRNMSYARLMKEQKKV